MICCLKRGIEDVGTIKLVLDDGLLWMGADLMLVPVWRSVRDGLTGKEELNVYGS